MKKYICIGLICGLIGLAGCGLLAVRQDETGRLHTQLSDALAEIARLTKEASSYIPGYGEIGTIGGTIIGAIASGILAIATRRKSTALNAVIGGVETGKTYQNVAIQKLVEMIRELNPVIAAHAQEELKSFPTISKIIKQYAVDANIQPYLDGIVQKITKEKPPVTQTQTSLT